MPRASLRAAAQHLPRNALTHHDLATKHGVDVDLPWLEAQARSWSRHWAGDDETTVSLATEVARSLKGQLDAPDLDLFIMTSSSSEVALPGPAYIVAERAGLKPRLAMDLSSGCTGFMVAMDIAEKYLRSGSRRVMIVSSEIPSRSLPKSQKDQNARRLSTTCGDGAGGVVLEATEQGGILGSARACAPQAWNRAVFRSYADPYASTLLDAPEESPGTAHHLGGDGENRYELDVTPVRFADVARRALAAASVSLSDVKWVIPHQPPHHVLARFSEELGVAPERMFTHHSRLGDTSSAAIPICLSEMQESRQLTRGDLLLLVSVGVDALAHVVEY